MLTEGNDYSIIRRFVRRQYHQPCMTVYLGPRGSPKGSNLQRMGNYDAKSQRGFGKEQAAACKFFFLSQSVSKKFGFYEKLRHLFNLHMFGSRC
jgi:hypothetical protein